MVTVGEIINKFEENTVLKLDEKSQNVLDEINELVHPLLNSNIWGSHLVNMVSKIKNNFVYNSDYCGYFFEVLNKNDYNKNTEIKDAILALGSFKMTTNLESDVVKYLKSPYIDSIVPTVGGFKIGSEQLGNFSFEKANEYFFQHPEVIRYIKSSPLRGKCHSHVEFLTSLNPDFDFICSLVENMYEGCSLYHSYCIDNNTNKVIDLTYNMVMDKEQYDKLFRSEEIFRLNGSQLDGAYNTAIRNNVDLIKYYGPFATTLFQQYIWENNFATPDCSIYSEEPHNPKLLMKNRFGSNN